MKYTLEIRPLAVLEIIEAYDWYESQKNGLGTEFIIELESFYAHLHTHPFSHSFYENPIRQGSLGRFPYTIVYEVFDTTIVVYSVFMQKQDPSKKRTI